MYLKLKHWSKKVLIITILLGIVGCSVISLGYNRLPTIALAQLDTIFDLTDEQSNLVRPELDRWLQWHRTVHLPQYVNKLQRFEKLIIQDLTAKQFCEEFEDIKRFADEAAIQFIPALVPIAKTLTKEQIENWNKYQSKQDEEFIMNFGRGPKGEKINEKRLEKAIDRAEMFYGSLTIQQKEFLAKRLERSVFNVEQVLPERKRRHQEALNAVSLIQKGASPIQTLQTVWRHNQQSLNPTYAEYSNRMLQDGCSQLAELHNKTTKEQRRKAAQKLNGYAKDFQNLIKS